MKENRTKKGSILKDILFGLYFFIVYSLGKVLFMFIKSIFDTIILITVIKPYNLMRYILHKSIINIFNIIKISKEIIHQTYNFLKNATRSTYEGLKIIFTETFKMLAYYLIIKPYEITELILSAFHKHTIKRTIFLGYKIKEHLQKKETKENYMDNLRLILIIIAISIIGIIILLILIKVLESSLITYNSPSYIGNFILDISSTDINRLDLDLNLNLIPLIILISTTILSIKACTKRY